MTPLAVLPLRPDRFPELAALFEEGGDPKWCWCTFFRFRGRDWSNSTATENRAALEHLAERDDLAPGLVGYRDGRAVGWVSLGPREDYGRLTTSKILAPVDDTPVWSIVCFVVSRARARAGRRERSPRSRDRVRPGARRDDARGLPGRQRQRACPAGERLRRPAVDLRTRRLHGRRTATVERLDTGPTDRPAVLER